jgi:type IV secretion system protein VirB6
MITLASDFIMKFSKPLEHFMSQGVLSLTEALKGPLRALLVLYIVLFGLLILLGYIQSPIHAFVLNIVKLVLILSLVTHVEDYNRYVIQWFFQDIPTFITQALGQVSSPNISNGDAFNVITENLIQFSLDLYKKGSWTEWQTFFASILVLFGLVPIGLLLGIVLLAKVGLTLVLVLGPVFISLVLFRQTQGFTFAWINTLVNFIVLQVLSVVFCSLLISILKDFISSYKDIPDGNEIKTAMSLVMVYVVSFMLTCFLPRIASQLSASGFQMGSELIQSGMEQFLRIRRSNERFFVNRMSRK